MSDPWIRPARDPWARGNRQAAPARPAAASHPPAGWYPDPTGQVRYWDGRTWGPRAPRSRPTALIVIGYLGVLFLPIVGIVCGIVLLIKEHFAHGLAQVLLSFLSIALYVATFGPGY